MDAVSRWPAAARPRSRAARSPARPSRTRPAAACDRAPLSIGSGCANRQPATRESVTGNRQPATGNRESATGNRESAIGNRESGTALAVAPDAIVPSTPDVIALPAPVAIDRPPALRAIGVAARSSRATSVPSTTRCNRSHVDRGIRVSACRGASMRSSTTIVHTPDCATRLKALIARSSVRSSSVPGPCTLRSPGIQAGSRMPLVLDKAWPRTHSRRDNSTPAAAAGSGSKRSKVSMSATHSPRAVAAASAAHPRLVRPEDTGPCSSDICPRGRPPPRPRLTVSIAKDATASPGAGPSEVSVRSSFRARSKVWTAWSLWGAEDARAVIVSPFVLLFADHSETKANVKGLRRGVIARWPCGLTGAAGPGDRRTPSGRRSRPKPRARGR